MSDSGIFGLFWPDIDDAASAKAASRLGFWAAVWMCVWTAAVVTYGLTRDAANPSPIGAYAYLDALVFAVLAWGIWRLWLAAAIIALALFLLEQVFAYFRTGSMVGLIMPVVLTLFFISGVRGTFAYRKLSKTSESEPMADA